MDRFIGKGAGVQSQLPGPIRQQPSDGDRQEETDPKAVPAQLLDMSELIVLVAHPLVCTNLRLWPTER